MLSFVKILLLLMFSAMVFANTQDLAEELISESEKQAEKYIFEAQKLQQKSEITTNQLLKNPKGCSLTCIKPKGVIEETETTAKGKEKGRILVFISFSMPKESLKSLFMQAKQQNVEFILRGLKNNSFKETTQILKDLSISVNIDPNLFDKHKIVTVPTFVYLKGNEELILHGNISLAYAHEKFKGSS